LTENTISTINPTWNIHQVLTKRILEELLVVRSNINHNWKNLKQSKNTIKKMDVNSSARKPRTIP
jgi:cell division protein FtsL